MNSKDTSTNGTDEDQSKMLGGRVGDLYMTTYSEGKGKGRNGDD